MAKMTIIRPPLVSSRSSYSVVSCPPVGLAYVCAALEAAGHQVVVIDATGEAPRYSTKTRQPGLFAHGLPISEIVRRIPRDSDAVALSAMFSVGWPHDEDICRAIRAEFPRLPIIVGGEHATALWDYLLRACPSVTVCALGESEETAVELANWIDGRARLESIPGIAFRKEGAPFQTPRRARALRVDDIPRPAWHLFPMESYFLHGTAAGVDLGRSMPMIATRGCPYQCTFCSSPEMWTTRYSMRSAVDVVDEMEYYAEKYQVRNIDFQDLTLVVKRDWILSFCRELERRGLGMTYQLPTGTRSEVLDEEVLRGLWRTGCRNIAYAPESASERTLQTMKKRLRLDKLAESVRTAARLGFVVRVHFILGYPGETRWDLLQTFLFALKLTWLGVEDMLVFGFSPYPGSEVYEELRRSGRVPPPSNDYFASLDTMSLNWMPSYCAATGMELSVYRVLLMGACVIAGLMSHPGRLIRIFRNIRLRRSESALEKNLNTLFAGRARAVVAAPPL